MKNKCVDCGNCCSETEMILSSQDVDRIKNNNPKNLRIFNFVKKTVDGLFQLKNTDGYCVFFDPSTKLCEIYSVRPQGCRFYPLIYDSDKRICVLDQECPRTELFYPNKNSHLKTRFKNLFDVAKYYYSNEWDAKLDNLIDLSRILSGESLKDLSEYCSQERVETLGKIVDKYTYLFDDGNAKDQIVRAFTADKPVTSINIYDQNCKIVSQFIAQLEDFFF